ncbi:hypothetical protein BC567DRAFT_54754 [Phyllosticta citribraziliensis]
MQTKSLSCRILLPLRTQMSTLPSGLSMTHFISTISQFNITSPSFPNVSYTIQLVFRLQRSSGSPHKRSKIQPTV